MLPHNSLKDEHVDILLSDNKRIIANGVQQNLIAARQKRFEDARKIKEFQNTINNIQLAQSNMTIEPNTIFISTSYHLLRNLLQIN